MKHLKRFPEFIRFVMVGILATALHYGIYFLLQRFINVNIAYTLGYALSFIANFYLTAYFTFGRVLQVGIHYHAAVSGGVVEACKHGDFLAEVAREVHEIYPTDSGLQRRSDAPYPISALDRTYQPQQHLCMGNPIYQ